MSENIKNTLSPRQKRVTITGWDFRYKNDQSELKVTTCNVRTLYQDGKLENVINEMVKYQWDILGVSEVRWTDCGDIPTYNNTHFYYSGGQKHEHGVGFIVSKEISACVTGYIPYSDRVILLQINTKPIRTNIIQVYAPTAESTQEECEKFYEDINSMLKIVKKQEIVFIMGDFNAKVGKTPVHNIVGQFGLGDRNERGDRLIEFCAEHNLTIMNSWFKLPKRRLYTWESPSHTNAKIVRNQIDFICINRRIEIVLNV